MDEVLRVVGNNGLAVVIAVLSVYTLFKVINIALDRVKKKAATTLHDDLVDLRKRVGEDIEELLEKALIQTRAGKVCVFEFHNGTTSFGGLPFLKMSNTYEVVAEGVAPQQGNLMDMSCLLYQKLVRALDLHPYVILAVKHRAEEYGHLTYETLVEQGTVEEVMVRFVDKRNRTAGFVCIAFKCDTEDTKCTEDVIAVARELAIKVGVLLAVV